MNAGASTSAVPSPIEGLGTAWVLLGSWALSPARPTPIHPRPERRGFSALLVNLHDLIALDLPQLVRLLKNRNITHALDLGVAEDTVLEMRDQGQHAIPR